MKEAGHDYDGAVRSARWHASRATRSLPRRTPFDLRARVWRINPSPFCTFGAADTSPPPAPSPGTFGISGNYDFTLRASSSCTNLPDEAKVRTYPAAVDHSPGSSVLGNLRVVLSGAQFAGPEAYCVPGNWLVGKVDGSSVRIEFTTTEVAPCEDWGHLPALAERLGPNAYLAIKGTGEGSISDATISGLLNGVFLLGAYPNAFLDDAVIAECQAPDHRFTMRRR